MAAKRLRKTVTTRLNSATVHIHAAQIGEVGRVKVLLNGDKVLIRVERDDEAWFGTVNIEVV